MKIPLAPPSLESLTNNEDTFAFLLRTFEMEQVQQGRFEGKYLHWDKLRHLAMPDSFSHEQIWRLMKLQRITQFKILPFVDKNQKHFVFLQDDVISEKLHRLDMNAAGRIMMDSRITNRETRNEYIVSSLIEEAIRSSQLEGATTSRVEAKRMIQSSRPPVNKPERMILNNYRMMEQLGQIKEQPLSEKLIFQIHRTLTNATLDDPATAGRLRTAKELERVRVVDEQNQQVLHVPPVAEQLPKRLSALCDFANGKTPGYFVHPVLRAIILHFVLAYDHPFVDGNGRTARALFYWSMLRNGYWLFEYLSISRAIIQARAKYGRAFLYPETDQGDLTYFILYHLEIIDQTMDALSDYLERRQQRMQEVTMRLQKIRTLNHRQQALVEHALRHPSYDYTFQEHQAYHRVAYQTARTDLLELEQKGLLISSKRGKTFIFRAVQDLEQNLKSLED